MADENTASDTPSEAPEVSGQVSEGTETTEPTGQAEQAPATPDTGTVEGKYGKFGDDPDKAYEGYQNLEKKLGNWETTTSKAQKYDELMGDFQDPQQPAQKPETPEGEQKAEQAEEDNWLDQIGKRVDKVVEKRVSEQIRPMQDYIKAQAEERIKANVATEIKEFRDKHKLDDNEWKAISLNPDFRKFVTMTNPQTRERMTLDDAYKVFDYENSRQKTVDETYKNIRDKSRAPKAKASPETQTEEGSMSLEDSIKDALRTTE